MASFFPFIRGISLILASLLSSTAVLTSMAHAEAVADIEAPVVEFEPFIEGTADRSQVFTVQAADNNDIDGVTLYHRRAGEKRFFPAGMRPLGSTGYYSVSIPTDPTDLRTIEYYLQAYDVAGNRTVKGFAFDPFQRTLSPSPALISAATESPEAVTTRSGNDSTVRATKSRRWWAVALGVVAVGTLAALASSNGGSDSGGQSVGNSGRVPLNLNIQEP